MCFLVTAAKERNFRHFSKRYVKKSLIYALSVHVGTYSKETHTFPEKEPYQTAITIVEQTTLDFDGVYDIAGETVLATDAMGNPTKTVKYYKKVVAGTTEDETEPPTDPDENEGPDII